MPSLYFDYEMQDGATSISVSGSSLSNSVPEFTRLLLISGEGIHSTSRDKRGSFKSH